MQKLFVYGTLCDPYILKSIIGRDVLSEPDKLLGFEMGVINLGNRQYPIIKLSSNSNSVIQGLVLSVTNSELEKLDCYETDAYKRQKVKLESGIDCWVYLASNKI